MIYFVVFFVTSMCAYEAKKGRKIYSAVLIIGMALFAGLRDYTIGTDILVYGNSLFNSAKQLDFGEFMYRSYEWYGIEPLYASMTYLVSLFAQDAHILYFVIELIIITLVYKRLLQLDKPISAALGMFIFQCLFIGETFNLMRQSIAMAIIFYASQYLERKKYGKFLLFVLIAIGFHSTAIIGLFIMLMYILISRKNTFWTQVLIIAGGCFITLFYSKALDIMIQIGIISQKYMRYTSAIDQSFNLNIIMIRLPILILIFMFYNKYYKYSEVKNIFLIDVLILEIVLAELRVVSSSIYRISIYLAYFKMLAYPELEVALKLKKNKQVFCMILILYCLVVFIYQIIIQGNNEIYPYKLFFT